MPTARFASRPYWDLLQNPIPESNDERFYVERVRALHHDSVAGRDVAGPDRIAAERRQRLERQRRAARPRIGRARCTRSRSAWPTSKATAKYNDMEYARRVAASIGSVHHERLLTHRRIPSDDSDDDRRDGRSRVRAVGRLPPPRAAARSRRRPARRHHRRSQRRAVLRARRHDSHPRGLLPSLAAVPAAAEMAASGAGGPGAGALTAAARRSAAGRTRRRVLLELRDGVDGHGQGAVLAPDVLSGDAARGTHPCRIRAAGSTRARTPTATISPTSSTR